MWRGGGIHSAAGCAAASARLQSYRREVQERQVERQGEAQQQRSPSLGPSDWEWQVRGGAGWSCCMGA